MFIKKVFFVLLALLGLFKKKIIMNFQKLPNCKSWSNLVTLLSSINALRGRFVEQKLLISCSFRCDRIYSNHGDELGHTLLCCLSSTYMFNKPPSEAGLLHI